MASKKPDPGKKPEPKSIAAKAIAKAASKAKRTQPPKPKGRAPARQKKAATSQGAATVIAPVDEDTDTDPAGDLCGLSVRDARFIDLYLLTHQVERSYIEAGFQAKPGPSAQACASRLLSQAKSRAYIAKRTKAMFDDLAGQQQRLMNVLTDTAYADAREVSEYRRGACRYCHGKMNRYQYTAGEWDAIITKHADKQEKAEEAGLPMPPEPDPKGGAGYRWGREPHPECPECDGWGVGKNIVKDTRYLSPAALAMFIGVKEGKDGIEARMHDQMKAREMLAKTFKLCEDSTTVNVKIDATELDEKYGATMRAAHERMLQMRQEREAERAKRGD